ncbi:glycogenin-1-like isoform X2 [Eriocheir sinensis]|uniref:glycogenin-1-like isoform X1 n=1 Tax=Eriocheir sinensis TaxID=95602 RepID=UPI0021C910A9|nr:glycogenin-1-like isoform X1 [Eriocheir sinensis]XP_050718612.1 glycogenin-1-like isoform X2 [Eriocheir sinensis]
MSEAYVTLATNDGYAVGALVLGHSLRSNNTSRDLIVMIAPAVSPAIRSLLEGVFNKVVVVDVLDSGDSAHLALMKRPELGITFTKLHCWTFTEYSKCVFLDADMLCVQNPDDLFSHPELTAACDVGWPDCFNSGMFVFAPSQDTYNRLLQHAETAGSFDGGDQGLLNTFFTDWHRVSFVYNMVASATYTYLPAYKQYGGDAKLIHFLGALKPWQHRYDSNTGNVDTPAGYQHLAPYLNSWWAIYNRLVKPGVPDVDLQNVDVKTPLEDVQEVKECLQTVDKEVHNELCNSIPVYIEEVKAEPSVQSPEWCDTDRVFIEKVENEPIVESCGVPPSSRKHHEPDKSSEVPPSLKESGETICENYKLTLSPRESHEPTEIFKVPNSADDSDLCLSTEIDVNKTKDREANMESESKELATSVKCELQEVASQFSTMTVHEESLEEGKARWERGQPDYLGRDSFDNIKAYIDNKLKSNGK